MKSASKVSPEAMQVFLKQAALERSWSAGYLGKALGLDAPTANRVAEEMALAGYVEAVRGKKETWRNMASGNKLAGVRPARLARAKAEELLSDLEDRAAQFAMGRLTDPHSASRSFWQYPHGARSDPGH